MAVQYGELKITWLGHNGFLLEAHGKKIYVDPFQIDGREKPSADYLLITHSHYDHLSIPDIEQIITAETVVLCPPDCQSKLLKFKMKQLKTLEPGTEFEDSLLRVLAVPSYNKDKPFHPRDNDWLGYLITTAEVTVYHSGDSDLIPEMADIECNIALLPVSGTYVMNAAEAAEAVEVIEPEIAIPMHWGALIGTHDDAQAFKKAVGSKAKVVILEKE